MAKSSQSIVEVLAAYGAPDRPVGCPSWYQLDRFRMRELSGPDHETMRAHVAACVFCRQRLEDEDQAFCAAVAKTLSQVRADGPLTSASIKPNTARTRVVIPLAMVAMAAAAALMVVPRAERERFRSEAGTDSASSLVHARRKGAEHIQLSAFREHRGEVEQMADGAVVSPGDRVRFQIGAPINLHVMIVGVEENGQLFAYYPLDGQHRSAHHDGGRVLLDGAAEFDESHGRESIVLVACSHPFDLAALRSGIPAGCQTDGFSIYKASR